MINGEKNFDLESNRSAEIAQAFYTEWHDPTDGDEVIAAFSKACYYLYTSQAEPLFNSCLNDALDDRTALPLSSNDVVNFTLRHFQKKRLKDDPKHYPHRTAGYEDYRLWTAVIEDDLSDPAGYDDFHNDLAWRLIQSTIASRSQPLKFVLRSEQERLGRPLNTIEFGPGDGHIMKTLGHNYGLEQSVDFVVVPPQDDESDDPETIICDTATALLRQALVDPLEALRIGVDLFDPNDPNTMLWILANSFRPKERNNPSRTELFEQLQAIKLQPIRPNTTTDTNLYFYHSDFSPEAMATFSQKHPNINLDVAMFPTSLYMQPQKAPEIIEFAHTLISEDGFVMIMDRVRPHPADPTKLDFFDHWGDFNFRLLIQYERGGRFYEIFKMNTDRCKQIAAGKDIGTIALGRQLQQLTNGG